MLEEWTPVEQPQCLCAERRHLVGTWTQPPEKGVLLSGAGVARWGVMRWVLQVLEKLQTIFSCCYRKGLPLLGLRSEVGVTLTGIGSRQGTPRNKWEVNRKEHEPSSSFSLAFPSSTLYGQNLKESSQKFQSQHHKADYRRLGLELRKNSLIIGIPTLDDQETQKSKIFIPKKVKIRPRNINIGA